VANKESSRYRTGVVYLDCEIMSYGGCDIVVIHKLKYVTIVWYLVDMQIDLS
jgi:hypothetical protein